MLAGNWVSIGLIYLIGYLIDLQDTYSTVLSPAKLELSHFKLSVI